MFSGAIGYGAVRTCHDSAYHGHLLAYRYDVATEAHLSACCVCQEANRQDGPRWEILTDRYSLQVGNIEGSSDATHELPGAWPS